MGTLDRVIAALKGESARLTKELENVRNAIAALTNIGKNSLRGRTPQRRHLSPVARRRIVTAQKARWAKWRARQKKAA